MRKLLLLLNFFVIFNSYGQSLVSKFDVAPNGANSVTFVDKSIGGTYILSVGISGRGTSCIQREKP